jgi:DNA polymerase (family 10)
VDEQKITPPSGLKTCGAAKMIETDKNVPSAKPIAGISNAEIADRLASLAQLLSSQRENPYKVKAYSRAASRIRDLSESLDEMVRRDEDLTQFSGIGTAIASAIREIVTTGVLGKLDKLRGNLSHVLVEISEHPRLDPKRVLRVYKKLGITTIEELRSRLADGEVERLFGPRMSQHIRGGLIESHSMLLYRANNLRDAVQKFLIRVCNVRRAEVAGDFRRRIEVIEELVFVIDTDDFSGVVERMEHYGGRTPLLSAGKDQASFAMPSGLVLRLQLASEQDWGFHMLAATGSEAHLKKLAFSAPRLRSLKPVGLKSETSLYRKLRLRYIEPELREGNDEVERAKTGNLPSLITIADICGDLHAHSTASDGVDSIADMAEAARERGYEYLGITDHSQSLKIAGGVSVRDMRAQIRLIDNFNSKCGGSLILKSSEVDILADGALDYPDELLRELDYTVCSIHSRFGLGREAQTERIMRAMDNRHFNILGHATGRLLLKRPGYEIDIDRIIRHARQNGCFFEINSSPDRLDLSAPNARKASNAGVLISIATDSHRTTELDLLRCGLDQARRAGLQKTDVLNCLPWKKLERMFKR